jgi:A/G-specific adenine glycosylase
MTPDQAKAFRRRLLAWYRKHRRDLPWRAMNERAVNPYHVLLSEAMLQQTQVATVVPYFNRFIEAFPKVFDLAEADEQQVLTLWQGLGYYRRARNLHAAAKVIVDDFNSEIPSTVNDLLNLPGVGQYTAGAIASIAHGTLAAVVDGNVERVFARLMLIEAPINAPATKKKVWAIAEDLVPKSNPGDYNQALMELGAMICTPKLPKCFVCPVREHCRGVQETNPERLPIKLAKKKPKEVTHVVIAAERNGKYLFEQRPSEGLWSNMWQMPTWEEPPVSRCLQGDASSAGQPDANTRVALQATANKALRDWVKERFGFSVTGVTQVTDFTHQTTHRTIRFVVLHATVQSGRLKANSGVWHKPDQLQDLPMSNPQRKAIESL